MRRSATWAIALASAACAANPNPVPMIGTAADLSALAGEWTGEYRSDETGRSGSIMFRLDAGKDTAFGDVLMIPRETRMAMPEPRTPTEMMRTSPSVLTIRFVRVSGPMVAGTIEPYRSPDCGCLLSTVFRGQISGDRIEGEFLIRHSEHEMAPQRGTWWATRVRKAIAGA